MQGMQVCRRWLYVLGRSETLWYDTDLEPHHKAVTDDVLGALLKKYAESWGVRSEARLGRGHRKRCVLGCV